ncbi:MAG: DNA mismatch repair protein MutS [Planctomycetota bacterium]|jgi:DNA mismatch repair protein MutS
MKSAPSKAKRARDPRDTPAMRQHRRFKEQHPDCILMFRMGDFYELFDDDAELVHRVLGLTLTQRTEGVPMAGVPYHALDGYLQKLITQGYRVAVCDQVQDPREAKGVVERAVTRVLTPGTLVDEALLEEARPNQIAAVRLPDDPGGDAAVAIAEVSTGRFTVTPVPLPRLGDELARLAPAELLYPETPDGVVPEAIDRAARSVECPLTARPDWTFRPADAADLLKRHFGVRSLEGYGLADDDDEVASAGALVRYLLETQAPDGAEESSRLAHLRPPRREQRDDHLLIDATSLRALEIERTMRSGETRGSLLSVLQRCVTPMGKRLLRRWLCFPLRRREAIEARQGAVAAFAADATLSARLADEIRPVQDVARIVGRIATRRANPRDLVALGGSVGHVGALVDLLDGPPAFADHAARLTTLRAVLAPLAETIGRRCVDAPPPHLRDGGLFRDGIDDVLDEARSLQQDGTTWLARYQQELVESTGIPSLKVGYNKVFGYYIEVTHTHTARVPDAFTRKQTLKNAERYITPELKTYEEKVTTAQTRAIEREKDLFDELCEEIRTHVTALGDYADVVAELDVLACFADTALRRGYVRPELTDVPVLDIRQGRHPVLDELLGDRFVPNDCVLGSEDSTLALITGPNMAGKSTAIRQAAIITLLAHTGSFVPAESATIGLVDRIFTRIGASDELHSGQSTFMVEMTETANILHHATDRSLVILDEIGRGTSTLDGLALAWAIAETIADTGCRTLFATHYHELTELADRRENVTNLHVSVREWGEEIVFLYRILPGRTDRSYGIHVAKIAGLPRETIARATEVLESLAVHTSAPPTTEEVTTPPAPRDQLDLFNAAPEHPAVDELRSVDLEVLTPLAAFDALRRLREMVQSERSPG